MNEFLKQLSITTTGNYVEDKYTIEINNFNEFSLIYNKLEQSELITKDSDESFFNMDEAHVVYLSDEYEILLLGDLNNDVYKLIVEEL